ncbi:hypothetical protein K2Z84_26330 [Candidatus Binatia bacterium]|nr:hypothetical protein [Candidatus Binatia bacterium]
MTNELGGSWCTVRLTSLALALAMLLAVDAAPARGSAADSGTALAGVDQCHEASPPTRPKRNGAPCDDGDACTANDSCTMGVCGGTVLPGCRLDLQSCSVARGSGAGTVHDVVLDDGSGPRSFRIDRPLRVCAPASESGSLGDPSSHLTCTRLRAAAARSFTRRTLDTHDRFGSHALSILRPRELCAPSWPDGVPWSTRLDAYACHRVQGPSVDQQISFTDARGTTSLRVGRPVDLCVPVGIDGVPRRDGSVLLTCYETRRSGAAAPPSASITLENALGSETLRLGDRRRLCVATTVDSCARFTFTTVPGSATCGGSGFEWPPSPPLVGAIYDAASGGTKIADLGGSCSYFGGGNSAYFPAAQPASGDTRRFDATSCSGDVLPLVGSAGGAAAGCLEGPSADVKVCLNDTRLRCNVDADCPRPATSYGSFAFVGRCAKAPRCFSGAPFPFYSSLANACVVPISASSATGSVRPATGEISYSIAGSNIVYIDLANFFPATPCPQCIEGTCVGGARDGQACTPTGSLNQTSTDCLPKEADFFTFVGGGTTTLATAPGAMSAPDGMFCPGQRNAGAFGVSRVRRIEMNGTPAGSLLDLQPHPATFLTLGCGAASGDSLVDGLADLPGPGAGSVTGVLQMQR